MSAWLFEGDGLSPVLSIVDHASNRVPDGIKLGIDPALLETHIGWDIGAAALARALGYPVFLANVSRLVVDLNREVDADALIPLQTDGVMIRGNVGAHPERIAMWHEYHDALSERIAVMGPKLLISFHSFTPTLSTQAEVQRPWEIGILYNQDDRAARIALPMLASTGVVVGDQLPYSGKELNATMNRHGEGTGTPYLGIEVRQDLIGDGARVAIGDGGGVAIGDGAGVAKWAAVLRPVVAACLDALGEGREAGAL